jgi:hypothetical protein
MGIGAGALSMAAWLSACGIEGESGGGGGEDGGGFSTKSVTYSAT